ncbi:MAG: tandem-95 repeat protein [Magnetococcales bacterium]|nr:tandem-95 repeat protein [Magnetococcales bacterium]
MINHSALYPLRTPFDALFDDESFPLFADGLAGRGEQGYRNGWAGGASEESDQPVASLSFSQSFAVSETSLNSWVKLSSLLPMVEAGEAETITSWSSLDPAIPGLIPFETNNSALAARMTLWTDDFSDQRAAHHSVASSAADLPQIQSHVLSSHIPTDTLFDQQWHLLSTAHPDADLNVTQVWGEYTGQGVVMALIDDGVDYRHEDLVNQYNHDLDWDARNRDGDALAVARSDKHGTSVAGMMVAEDNGSGVVGVAPGAEVSGLRVSYSGRNVDAQFLTQLENMDAFDIVNNSWGYGGHFYDNFQRSSFAGEAQALEDAVTLGRDGLGTVITFSAGNSGDLGDNVNYHSFQNSPYTIAVGATDYQGEIAYFSTPGAAVLVSAPGYEVLTTDRVGTYGYENGDYVTISGTSFSAPAVAGVVALMLEANPDLGYRDVQEILAYSATQSISSESGWQTNGADNWNGGGLTFHDGYGFGLADAYAAVRLAESWTLQSTAYNLTEVTLSSAPALQIDNNSIIADVITNTEGLTIDHVQVLLDLDHSYIGELTVTLTSPDGTVSTLVDQPGLGRESDDDINFTLSSVQFWGETGVGDWTLSVSDVGNFNSGYLNSWTLNLMGDVLDDDDLYIYTDTYDDVGDEAARQVIHDDSGFDTLNFAAVTENLQIDLSALSDESSGVIDNAQVVADTDTVNTLWGHDLNLGPFVTIEQVVGGDGDDTIIGNDADNVLYGMRGDDTLTGGQGDDWLDGGQGSDIVVFSGLFADYELSENGEIVTVVDLSGDEGTDQLQNVEWASFLDGLQDLATLFDSSQEPEPEPIDPTPLAVDDSATTDKNSSVTLQVADLLSNDSDPNQLTLTITAVEGAVNGVVVLNGSEIVFTPDADFVGEGGFSYTLSNTTGETNTADVVVTVNQVYELPVAVADTLQGVEDLSLVFSASDLMLNDSGEVTNDITAVGSAANGSVSLDSGVITFTPTTDFNGQASFLYTLDNGHGSSDSAWVTITFESVNDAPIAVDDHLQTDQDVPLTIQIDSLLSNDQDVDLDGLSLVSVENSLSGDISLVDNVIVFTPDSGFAGDASFEYTVSDGVGGTDVGVVNISVAEWDDSIPGETITGTNRAENLVGSEGDDIIYGLGRNDVLEGLGGNDVMDGGSGRDILYGGDGNDTLNGGLRDDFLVGGAGDDLFEFGRRGGNDVVTDFELGVDHISLIDDLYLSAIQESDVNNDGQLDTILVLNYFDSVTLLGVSDATEDDLFL